MTKQLGTLHSKKTLFFRQFVGTAKSGEHEYEMAMSMGGSTPIIESKQTGQWFTLSWQDIIDLAVKAGIDKNKVSP